MNTALSESLPHLVILALISGVLMLGVRRVKHLIRLFTLQSLALIGMLLVLGGGLHAPANVWLMVIMAFVIKCLAIPYGFLQVFRRLNIRDHFYSYIQPPTLMLMGGLTLILAQLLVHRMALTQPNLSLDVLGCGVTLVLFGFLLMISRKKAMTQVLGLYVLDNGIFALAIATVFEMPLIVEMGAFLELVLGAMVMGLMMFRIQETFDSIDVSRLQNLKG